MECARGGERLREEKGRERRRGERGEREREEKGREREIYRE